MSRSRAALAAAVAAGLAAPAPAAAHAAGSAGGASRWIAALPVIALALLACAYAVGLWRAGPRARAGWRAGAFGLGLLAAAAAVVGPVEDAATGSLTAHMGQHLLLIAVAAPLLAIARPAGTLLRVLPRGARRLGGRAQGRLTRALARPAAVVGAGVLAVLVLIVWHLPGPYEAAVQREWVHQLEHATLVGSALVAWWGIVAAYRGGPARCAAGIACAAGALAGGGALGLAMMISTSPWYTAPGGEDYGLGDQQLAGAMMWGPGGVAFAAAAAVLTVRLLRDRPAPGRPAATGPSRR